LYETHLGGISGTLGGYIRYTWGVYQVHLGGISGTKKHYNLLKYKKNLPPKLI
jgi:hypothetical protein